MFFTLSKSFWFFAQPSSLIVLALIAGLALASIVARRGKAAGCHSCGPELRSAAATGARNFSAIAATRREFES